MSMLNRKYRSARRGHRLAALLAIALSATALVACGSDDSGGSGGDMELKIALYPGSLISFPARVAEEEGIFEKHGLSVELVDVQGGPNATAAVVSGSADIQLNSTDNNLLSRSHGQDMVAVSGNTTTPIMSVLVGNDFDAPNVDAGWPASIEDLEGAKIGVTQRGASVELVMRYLLDKAGLDPDKDVTWVAVGTPPTALPALEQGQIDVLVAFEPSQTQAVEIGKYARMALDLRTADLPPDLSLLQWEYNQWAALGSNVEDKREAFDAFQDAMEETYDFIADKANFDRLVEIGTKSIADDEQLVRTMLESNVQGFGFKIHQEAIDNTSEFLQEFDQIDEPISFEDYVDPRARG
jgi:NitT/TauT family transport system substrate-binding protein